MPEYRKLLWRASSAVTLCIAAVLVCYFWIDRPVAFFVYRHHISEFQIFHWLTYPPPEVQTWSPLVLAVLLVRRAWKPFLRWHKVILVACVSLIVADQFRIGLGDICGRYWPETWAHDNPSFIGSGVYGFHPFQRGDDCWQLSLGPRRQDLKLRRGMDHDAAEPSYRRCHLHSNARQPGGYELPFR